MTSILPREIAEAARLTRDGRLSEATALLRRHLTGEATPGQPDPGQPGSGGASPGPRPGPAPSRPSTLGSSSDGAAGKPGGAAGLAEAGAMAKQILSGLPGALRGLTELPGRLPGMLQGGWSAPEAPQPPAPEGAQFLARSFEGEGGCLAYRLYIPARRGTGPMPLLVMLHGCTQSAEDFAAGTRMNQLAEEKGFLVAYPAQSGSANMQRCWNWFRPGDQQRDAGEPGLIAGMAREILREDGADPSRVYVAGLSAGGAAAAILATRYPDLFAAAGVHSGLGCGAARDLPSALSAMRQGAAGLPAPPAGAGARLVPTIVFHADGDSTVNPRNGDQIIEQLQRSLPVDWRMRVEEGRVPNGHAWRRTLYADGSGRHPLEQWLVHGGGHAWSGGSPDGSYTDPKGPDASREMLRFFLEHPKG